LAVGEGRAPEILDTTSLDTAHRVSILYLMDFSTLIAPFNVQEFETRYLDREPVVIRGDRDCPRARLLDWARLNAMLQLRPHWTADRIKLVMQSRPIDPDFYMEDRNGRTLASPAKIEAMLSVGATLVGDMVEDIDPALAELTAMLSERFAGRAGANVYASFKGVQAFASHCDLHEVFAVQCEGAKRWRVYRNRADNPIEGLSGEGAQARIDAAKGPVLMDVTLEAGDLIYIPRGYFHDAVAIDSASLHVTISVAPPSGMLLFNFLSDLACADSMFRAYLPDGRTDDEAALSARLEALGDRLKALATSVTMRERIGLWRRQFHRPVHRLNLPHRPTPRQLTRTVRVATITESEQGSALVLESGVTIAIGILSDVATYILSRPAVVREEVCARFGHHPRAEVDLLMDKMVEAGLLTDQSR
jgi:bifunctional lysine-specific demethylase and histidyl-hydroxylase NO66